MKLEKLPSGSYRVQKMIEGKRHSITFDHKPKQDEINKEIAKLYTKISVDKRITFENAAKEYIESKRNVLSPRTVKEYKEMPKRLSESFIHMKVDSIKQLDIQNEINRLSKDKAPKTVRNYHGFISAVLRFYRPDMIISTTLPQKKKVEPYIPTDDEVKKVLAYIKEHHPAYYVCTTLAAYGLRRSEILAINSKSLTGNILRIDRAKVLNEDKEWVIKPTKTTESTREIRIPQEIADLIIEKDSAFDGYPNDIYKVVAKACDKTNVTRFSLHKLRHYFASKLLSENIDITTVMAMGGWQSTSVLRSHYAHAMEEKKNEAFDIIDKICTWIAHEKLKNAVNMGIFRVFMTGSIPVIRRFLKAWIYCKK